MTSGVQDDNIKITSSLPWGFGTMVSCSENLLGGIGCNTDSACTIGVNLGGGSAIGQSFIVNIKK